MTASGLKLCPEENELSWLPETDRLTTQVVMSGGRWKCHFRQQVCGKTIDKCEYNAKITVLEHSVKS